MIKGTYTVDQVEDDAHSHAEFFKVQVSVIVNVGKVPDFGQLFILQLTVLEDRRCLISVEMSATVGEGRKNLPVAVYLPLFDFLVRHPVMCGVRVAFSDTEAN